jgi:hypothetical protein
MRHRLTTLLSLTLLVAFGLNSYGQNDSIAKTDTLEYKTSPFQMTFMFPPFSTNGWDNVNYVNNLSLNMFAGLSGGVDGIELGGFINVDRYFMKGFQGAGFGNAVGRDVEGVQLAGFFNVAGGDVRYVQGAGFVNATGGNQFGLQGAGFGNVVGGDLVGFEGAGFCNVVGGKMIGVQGAGFMNASGDTTTGIQGAGFINLAAKFNRGVQGAGFGNIAGPGKVNVQGAGFFNIADEIDGVQAAGFFNIAGYVKGLQAAGFINICDSIDGIPIAFISIVKHNGYRKLELSSSETQYVRMAYKMGVKKFYTIYSFGKPVGPTSRFMYGAGIGSLIPLSEKSFLNLELTANQEIWIGDERSPWFVYQNRLNMQNELFAAFGMNLGNRLEFFVGPTLNISVAHSHLADDVHIPWEPLAPKWASLNRTYNSYHQTNVAMWVGLKGGVRF